ncbi:MAG: hypothetical protein ACON4T_06675 [Synechococcus sp.]
MSSLALRRHLLPRYWLGITLGGLALLCGLAYWWERQLPGRLDKAIRDQDTLACLHYSEQLAALRWLGQHAPEEQALCRRQAAQQAWNEGRYSDALGFQEQLVNSGIGNSAMQQQDQRQLKDWREDLRNDALDAFLKGDLDGALTRLQVVERGITHSGGHLSDSLQETWTRNQLEHQRLADMVQAKRWWEALAVLNRMDHPWWQTKAKPLRRVVEQAIDQRKDLEEHQNHGDLPAHTVPNRALDQAVKRRIKEGMEPWKAFKTGCADVGGRVEEEGPESLCRRR